MTKFDETIIVNGLRMFPEWSVEKRSLILRDFQIAKAVAARNGSPDPVAEAAGQVIFQHDLAAEMGLDYEAAGGKFLTLIGCRNRLLAWVLNEAAGQALEGLRELTVRESGVGAAPEDLLAAALRLAFNVAAVDAAEPVGTLVNGADDPYIQGRIARAKGEAADSCPYDAEGEGDERADWLEGWTAEPAWKLETE